MPENAGIWAKLWSCALRLRLRAGVPPARCVLVLFFPGTTTTPRSQKTGFAPSQPAQQRRSLGALVRGDPVPSPAIGCGVPVRGLETFVDNVDEGGPIQPA